MMVFCFACNGHGYLVVKQRVGNKMTYQSQGCRECLTSGRVTELELAAQVAANEERKARSAAVLKAWRERN